MLKVSSPVIMDTPTWVPSPSRQPVVCIHILLVSSYVAHCDAVSSVPRTCTPVCSKQCPPRSFADRD